MKRLFYFIVLSLVFQTCQTDSKFLVTNPTDQFFSPALKPFYHGVASGDPLQNAVIIWTRVTPKYYQPVVVKWRMALDSTMENIIQRGKIVTDDSKDFTIKIDVQNLRPDTYYFYQFEALGQKSMIGRTKTAPVSAEQLRLAIVSCSNYEGGFFNAYGHLARQNDLDAILHLGDYIYEYEPKRYGDSATGRFHLPEREIVTLSDYRTRYGQYRLDTNLQRVHQLHPFITIWDDHEITNNAYANGAENHQSSEGPFDIRKNIARQAYFEWLPIRPTLNQFLYRSFSFGNLAEVIMLDERLAGRQEQLASIDDPNLNDEQRTMLGKPQLDWLLNTLSKSTATWKIIGNQVIFAPLNISSTFKNRPFNLDAWDGYPAEKQRIQSFIEQKKIKNVAFVTGDSHCSWAFEIPLEKAGHSAKATISNVAVELCAPGISSPNYSSYFDKESITKIEKGYLKDNPHLRFVNLDRQGYFLLTVSQKKLVADWFFAHSVKRPDLSSFKGKTLTVKAGNNQLLEVEED